MASSLVCSVMQAYFAIVTVYSVGLSVLDKARRFLDADDGRQSVLAGYDSRVRQLPTGLRDNATYAQEEWSSPRVGEGHDQDVLTGQRRWRLGWVVDDAGCPLCDPRIAGDSHQAFPVHAR